jgi:hypothetical protein
MSEAEQPKPKSHQPKVEPVFILQAVLGIPKAEAIPKVAAMSDDIKAALVAAYQAKDRVTIIRLTYPEHPAAQT